MNRELDQKIQRVIGEKSMRELAIGYLRYQTVRSLTPYEFAQVCQRILETKVPFDQILDELV